MEMKGAMRWFREIPREGISMSLIKKLDKDGVVVLPMQKEDLYI